MKTKCKMLVMALVVIGTFFNLNPSQAQTSSQEPVRDARRIAASFLKLGPEASFNGNFDYSVVISEGVAKYTSGSFIASVNPDGTLKAFTSFTINGQSVPLDEPLTRFPYDERGKVTSFWLAVTGYSADNKWVSSGSFHADALQASDPIKITLRPGWVENFIPAKLPSGVIADNFRLKTADGNIYWYDQYRQGFSVWLDPVVTNEMSYDLFDASTDTLVQSGGTIRTFVGPAQSPDNAIGSTREGGVVIATVGPDSRYAWFGNQKFKTTYEYYEHQLPAAVYGVRGLAGGNISVRVNSLSSQQAMVRIEEVLKDGSLALIKEVLVENEDGVTLETQGSYNEVVITVFGIEGADQNGFYMNLNWQPPQTGNSGGGSVSVGN